MIIVCHFREKYVRSKTSTKKRAWGLSAKMKITFFKIIQEL